MSQRADARPRSASMAGGAAPGRRFPRGVAVAGLLAAAWLVPVLTQVLRADWLLLVVLLAGIASVLRAGYFLLDRLMLAGVVLTGSLIAGGWLFSLWPWGLEPVPVAGTLLTFLVAVGVLTGRRPSLPLRLRGSDAIIVGAGVVSAGIMLAPVASRSFVGRLPFIASPRDKFVHFSIFDAIHRLGGYLFLHPTKVSTSVGETTAAVYPQGSHYLYAVLDIFLRSTTSPGPAPAEYSRYFTYTLIGYGLLVLAVTWAARWVAGPALTGWRSAVVCSAVATLAAAGPLSALIRFAFDSETVGLALLALTVAVTARPAGRPKEQVLLAAAALVSLCYAYNLYGAVAGLGIIVSALVYRRRLLRHRVFTAGTAAVAVPIALLPSVLGLRSPKFSPAGQLIAGGSVFKISPILLIVLALVVVSSIATRTGRRSGVWRALSAQLALTAAAALAVGLYQAGTVGHTSYYFYKIETAGYIICLVGLGAAVLWLKPARASESAPRRRQWRIELLPSLYAAAIAATLTFVLVAGSAVVQGAQPAASFLDSWWSGRPTSNVWPALDVLDRLHVLGDGKPTLVLYSNAKRNNYLASYFAGALNRDLNITQPTFDPLYYISPITGNGDTSYDRVRTANDVKLEQAIIAGGARHLRVIVADRQLDAMLRSFARAHPALAMTVSYMPQLSESSTRP